VGPRWPPVPDIPKHYLPVLFVKRIPLFYAMSKNPQFSSMWCESHMACAACIAPSILGRYGPATLLVQVPPHTIYSLLSIYLPKKVPHTKCTNAEQTIHTRGAVPVTGKSRAPNNIPQPARSTPGRDHYSSNFAALCAAL
jgi:hypothetical protein